LSELILAFACYAGAMLIIGCILACLAWIFNHGPAWSQAATLLLIASLFVSGIIFGIRDYEVRPYYADEMIYTDGEGSDRYR
jgi:TRAP-type C4-dicarboxylate transport system permease small subunit